MLGANDSVGWRAEGRGEVHARGMARKKKEPQVGMTKRERLRVINIVMYSLTGVFAVAILYSVVVKRTPRMSRQTARQADAQASPAAAASAPATCPTRAAEDWEYDSPTNCYFDPSPGHGHWHSGQPPDAAERAKRMAPPAPAPVRLPPALPPPNLPSPPGGPPADLVVSNRGGGIVVAVMAWVDRKACVARFFAASSPRGR